MARPGLDLSHSSVSVHSLFSLLVVDHSFVPLVGPIFRSMAIAWVLLAGLNQCQNFSRVSVPNPLLFLLSNYPGLVPCSY